MNLHQCAVSTFFRDNTALVTWVNQQPLASPLVCLGDGHDGIWNLFEQIGRRVKLSGAQWNPDNVQQVLLYRCAYLDGSFSA